MLGLILLSIVVADAPKEAHASNVAGKNKVAPVVVPGELMESFKCDLGYFEPISSDKRKLAQCVEEQHRREPGVSGKLIMQWAVKPDGKATKITVVSTEHAKRYFAKCIADLVASWTFPRRKPPTDPILFPFRF